MIIGRSGNAHPAISTKEELLRRLREQRAPRCSAKLEPGISLTIDARREVDEENRKRIAVLRNTLDKASTEFETQQAFARLGGYSKSNFSKSR